MSGRLSCAFAAATLVTVSGFVPTNVARTPPAVQRTHTQLSSTLANGWAPPPTWTNVPLVAAPAMLSSTKDKLDRERHVLGRNLPLNPKDRAAVEGMQPRSEGTVSEVVGDLEVKLNTAARSAAVVTKAASADLAVRVSAVASALALSLAKFRVQMGALSVVLGAQLVQLRVVIAKICAKLVQSIELALSHLAAAATSPAVKTKVKAVKSAFVPPKSKVPPSSFASEMEAMFEDPFHKDVAFSVGGVEIAAHKAILFSRCDYFKRMFAPGAAAGGVIPVAETTPAAFKSILRYLYTDELLFADSDVLHVMRKAKEMGLAKVYEHTVEHCERTISEANAVVWFLQAEEHGISEMREVAFRYLTRNFRRIRENSGTSLEMLKAKPDLMMSVMLAAI